VREEFDPTFYATVAQIIPVIFVVLAIELRWFRPAVDETPQSALFRLTLIVSLGVSELFCVTTLHADRAPADIVDAVIIVTLGLTGIAAIGPFLRAPIASLRRRRVTRALLIVLGYGGLILIVIATVGVIPPNTAIAAIAIAVFVSWAVAAFAGDIHELRSKGDDDGDISSDDSSDD
jgi:hypothetical protein